MRRACSPPRPAWRPEAAMRIVSPGETGLATGPRLTHAHAHTLHGLRPPRSNARVRIFNVKYSPNLGDGLLSECLEQALIEAGTSPDTWSVDLAGRIAYGPGSSGRAVQMRVLDAVPEGLRRLAVRLPLALQAARRWRPHYRQALSGAGCVVIGGGNLFTDLDLNFPTKIALAVDEAARHGLPVFIYACGVSGGWSPRGKALLAGALRTGAIRRVFVRDERSRLNWNRLAEASGLQATLVRDPGLLAAARYGLRPDSPVGGPATVGINLTSQLALRYHSHQPLSPAALDAWYLDLARALLARGLRVTVFTNGSPEDRACAERLRPAFAALPGAEAITFAQPDTPEELARLIAGLSGIAAFRMHAVIAAYGCGVPFLALAWDPKLEAFLASVDRMERLCRPTLTPGAPAAERLLAAMRERIPAPERERVVAQARRGVAMLQEEIARATGIA